MLLIAVGILLLGSELHFWGGVYIARHWPLVLLVLGAAFVILPGENGRAGGMWLLLTGGIFLLHTYRILSLRDSWPLFIVATGISVLAGGLKRPAPPKEIS